MAVFEEKVPDEVRWVIANPEVAPQTGHEHVQGYCVFEHQHTISALSKTPGFRGWHWEPRRGSHVQARDYCRKGRNCSEWHPTGCEFCPSTGHRTLGEEPAESPGKKQKLGQVVAEVQGGMSMASLAAQFPEQYVRYYRGLQALSSQLVQPRTEPTEMIIIEGAPGVGKTRWIYDTWGRDEVYMFTCEKWVDGLCHTHKVAVKDDWYGQDKFHHMLRLADRYPLQLEIKGGMVNFNVRYLILTTNKDPYHFYDSEKMHHDWRPAFFRRCAKIYRVKDDGWYLHQDSVPEGAKRHSDYAAGRNNYKLLVAPPRLSPDGFVIEDLMDDQ